MVFSTLSQEDRDAFFELLDEYFESRPGLFSAPSTNGVPVASSNIPNVPNVPAPARAAAISAMSSPQVQNGVVGVLKRGAAAAPAASSLAPPARSGPPSIPPRVPTPNKPVETAYPEEEEENEDIDEAPVSVADRIKAAQAALGAGGVGGKPPVPGGRRTSMKPPPSDYSSTPSSPPPPPARGGPPAPPPRTTPSPPSATVSAPPPPTPRRTPSGTTTEVAPHTSVRPGGAGGLVTSRGIGSIDTSSAGAAASSVFSFKGMGKNDKKGPDVYSTQPAAFNKPKTKDTYAPPPRRADTKKNGAGRKQEPEPEPEEEEPEQEEEYAQGEWVEALYEFESSDATDLSFKAKDQLWVTERTSKDWWMAEKDGRSGLVPAAYVKPLQ